MISAMVYQLTRSLCMDEIKSSGFDAYFVDHTTGIYPVSAGGIPFKMDYLASKGDIITDLHEDLAADGATLKGQQAKTYYNGRFQDSPGGFPLDERMLFSFDLDTKEVRQYEFSWSTNSAGYHDGQKLGTPTS